MADRKYFNPSYVAKCFFVVDTGVYIYDDYILGENITEEPLEQTTKTISLK